MYHYSLLILFFLVNFFSCAWGYELCIAAIFKQEGPFLKEWIEYHRMVGVEHFYLYNNSSTDDYLEVLDPYLAEGIVDLMDWPTKKGNAFKIDHMRAFADAIKKSSRVTKWLALIDIDEFLLPAGEATITECLDKHFPHASGVYVNWLNFGTNRMTLKKEESLLFRMTACAKTLHPCNGSGKSIVRPDQVDLTAISSEHHFLLNPDAQYYNGDAEPLYRSEIELLLDGKSHAKHIRINHYSLRDDHFFFNIKYPRAKALGDIELLFEHYSSFNEDSDEAIIHFILDRHPDMWETFWKNRVY